MDGDAGGVAVWVAVGVAEGDGTVMVGEGSVVGVVMAVVATTGLQPI
jgi:hypothetical protein